MDEDTVVLRCRKQQSNPSRESAEDHPKSGERVAALVKQPPAVGWEKGSKPQGVALLFQDIQILFEPESL
jgi:hypothetical protein